MKPGVFALVVALLALAAMGPASFNGFVYFDDYAYVTEHPRVRTGLTASGIAWAFTSFEAGNWHPLTWMSHMADVERFGLD